MRDRIGLLSSPKRLWNMPPILISPALPSISPMPVACAKVKPILCDAEPLWRCPVSVIEGSMKAEHEGFFDEFLMVGDQVRLADGILSACRENGVSNGVRAKILIPPATMLS